MIMAEARKERALSVTPFKTRAKPTGDRSMDDGPVLQLNRDRLVIELHQKSADGIHQHSWDTCADWADGMLVQSTLGWPGTTTNKVTDSRQLESKRLVIPKVESETYLTSFMLSRSRIRA